MKKRARERLRIIVTDDHATTRLGICRILEESFPGVVFGQAADALETSRKLATERWDLLILDISLPDRDGLDLLREIRRDHPDLPVLIFSVHPEDPFALRALRLRAAGYLTKERAPEELAAAVRKIVAGGTYITPSLAEQLAERIGSESTVLPHELLSDRESEVMRQLARGNPGKSIAAALGVSPKTVSTYRARVLKKMKLDTTAELIQYAVRHHLVR